MGGYAKLDSHREVRSGFPEVIFCSGKADEHFVHIFQKLYEDNGEVFGTRASRHQYELVKDLLPGVEYDDLHTSSRSKRSTKSTSARSQSVPQVQPISRLQRKLHRLQNTSELT